MPLEKVTRTKIKARLGVAGVSGSGKSYSALLLAKGLVGSWDKICVIDTENESSRAYAHLGDYYIYPLKPPFTPERFIDAFTEVENESQIELILLDGISPVWNGVGGVMDIVEKIGKGGWPHATSRYEKFKSLMLHSRCHVISTVRKKSDYRTADVSGKVKTIKYGTKEVIWENYEYDMQIYFEIDMDHKATPLKDRSELFKGDEPFQITEETGRIIRDWCEKGVDELENALSHARSIEDVLKIFNDEERQRIIGTLSEDKKKIIYKQFRRWNRDHTKMWQEYAGSFADVTDFTKFRESHFLSKPKPSDQLRYLNISPEVAMIFANAKAVLIGESVSVNATDDYADLNEQTASETDKEETTLLGASAIKQDIEPKMPDEQFEKMCREIKTKRSRKLLYAFYDKHKELPMDKLQKSVFDKVYSTQKKAVQ